MRWAPVEVRVTGAVPGRMPACPGRGGVQRGVGGEDPLVQLAKREAGVAAEFFGQPQPGLPVVVEGIGGAAGPVEREDELAGQTFVQRMCSGPGGQPGQ